MYLARIQMCTLFEPDTAKPYYRPPQFIIHTILTF
jgi:hypothetical protein